MKYLTYMLWEMQYITILHSQASRGINYWHYEMCYDVRLGAWLGQTPICACLQVLTSCTCEL